MTHKSKLTLSSKHFYLLSAVCAILVGCSTTQSPAPVVDRARNMAPVTSKPIEANIQNNQVYTVQKGDTLSKIAINQGIDYKRLIELNNIRDPNSIRPGQQLMIPTLALAENESKPILYALPQQPITTAIEPGVSPSESLPFVPSDDATGGAVMGGGKIKTSPKALKQPYSEQIGARTQQSANASVAAAQVTPSVVNNDRTKIETVSQSESTQSDHASGQSIKDWIWPTDGKVVSTFSRNSKGVKISGQAGQSVLASAAGVVVYSGNGLRGYGNLIIIKHNDTFLSAYAHNNKLLVKEGEAVSKGQKIAEMGNTDSSVVQLHFEIRKNSKPVDPLEYLPRQS